MSASAALAAEGLVKRYPGRFTLSIEHLRVESGSVLAILGPSGSGKSTLLRILALLERPDEGQVLFGGVPAQRSDRPAQHGVTAVFQSPNLFHGSVSHNVEYGLRAQGVSAVERSARARIALRAVGLDGIEAQDVSTLSGGEARRVALARALAVRPKVLLLDEPLASLDPPLKARMAEEFAGILAASGTTTVWVTHDMAEARAADTVALLRDGGVVAFGDKSDMLRDPGGDWARRFLGIEPQDGCDK